MKPPWQMNPDELRRHHETQVAELIRLVDTATFNAPALNSRRLSMGTASGDERKLRGIPAIGRGVSGCIPGTSPHSVR